MVSGQWPVALPPNNLVICHCFTENDLAFSPAKAMAKSCVARNAQNAYFVLDCAAGMCDTSAQTERMPDRPASAKREKRQQRAPRLVSSYEVPFANANGKTVTPEACRAFGRASARVLRAFLEE